jgi:hypothetical protein
MKNLTPSIREIGTIDEAAKGQVIGANIEFPTGWWPCSQSLTLNVGPVTVPGPAPVTVGPVPITVGSVCV